MMDDDDLFAPLAIIGGAAILGAVICVGMVTAVEVLFGVQRPIPMPVLAAAAAGIASGIALIRITFQRSNTEEWK